MTWAAEPRLAAGRAVREAAEAALAHGGRAGLDLDVVLVDDETLRDLHGRFLGDATPTDVLAFDLGDDGHGPAGEVYASVDCARRVAARRGVEPARELCLYVVHGVLHLCGLDDRTAEARAAMRAAERTVLSSLGYPEDERPHDEGA